MIITIKNLQQQTFTVDFDSEKTVLELKEEIYKNRGGEYNVERQKLIYAGIILEDDRTVASYTIDEKKFVVVMLKRDVGGSSTQKPSEAPAAKAEAAPATTAKPAEAVKTNESPKASGGTPTREAQLESTAVETGGISQTRAESALLMGEEYNRSVESMVEMGYSRELVERAMAASYNNPERAVEYLISGIPDTAEGGFGAEQQPIRSRSESGGERTETRTTEGGNAADPFEFLRDQPQFLQMRSLVYQNPDLLHAVLQQIGQTNPALLQLITENQDAFLNMLNQPIEGQEENSSSQRHITPERRAQLNTAARAAAGTGNTARSNDGEDRTDVRAAAAATLGSLSAAGAGTGSGGEGRIADAQPPDGGRSCESEGPAVIRLTQAEQDAIERLKAMGFPEALVLQAYFACDKDEQLAANFLISSNFED